MKRVLFHPLSLLLSWRYLFTKDATLLFVTKTSVIGLVVSITVLLVVQGVIAGFQRDLSSNVMALVPHVTFSKEAGIDADLGRRVAEAVPAVEAVAVVVQSSGLVSTSEAVRRAQLIGLDPTTHVEFVGEQFEAEPVNWDALKAGAFHLLLGSGLARELAVDVGDSVLLTFASQGVSPFGYTPRQKRFVVVGRIKTHSALDSMVAYLHRDDARLLLQLRADANAVYFKVHDPLDLSSVFFSMYTAANERNLQAGTWQEMFGGLFNFLQRFKNLLFLLLFLLVAVATFNLVSSMVMLVYSRRADVAVLRTLGGNTGLILMSFLMTALVIAVASLLVCFILSWLIGLALPTLHGLLSQLVGSSPSEGFPLHRLSVVLDPSDVVRAVALTVLMVVLGSLYPAWRATRLAPTEILRNE